MRWTRAEWNEMVALTSGANSMTAMSVTHGAGIRSSVMDITPELARAWLELNTGNYRIISKQVVKNYARAMAAGEWKLNAEAVKFDDGLDNGGNLIDGQHRLCAVIESGVTIRSLVVWGVPVESADTLDNGKRRTTADTLRHQGKDHAALVAAAIIFLWQHEHGIPLGTTGLQYRPIRSEILQYAEMHPDLNRYVPLGRQAALMVGGTTSLFVALYYILSQISEDDAIVFFERIHDGALLKPDDGISMLRNRLIKVKGNRLLALPKMDEAAFTIKAWNSYRTGKPLVFLRWSLGGANPEVFPTPI